PMTGEEKNIILHYARFSVDVIKALTTTRLQADRYDADNINWSGDFLFNSISIEQRRYISDSMEQGTGREQERSGRVDVFRQNNMSTTIQAMLTLQNNLRGMKLSSYPGEDVTKCVHDISKICERLSAASKLPEDISQAICLILSECSVPTFQVAYMTMSSELMREPGKHEYRKVLEHATTYYQSLLDSGKLINTKKTTEQFQGLVSRVTKLEMGSSSNSVPSNVRCFRCKGNHYLKDCPQRTNNGNKKNGWKYHGSTAGTAATTKFVDGIKWNWCAKCKRWSTSHGTNNHRTKSSTGISSSDETAVTTNLSNVGLTMISGL
ncbi:MAG: hypothetical protein ACREBR_00235, partial [bacterium]